MEIRDGVVYMTCAQCGDTLPETSFWKNRGTYRTKLCNKCASDKYNGARRADPDRWAAELAGRKALRARRKVPLYRSSTAEAAATQAFLKDFFDVTKPLNTGETEDRGQVPEGAEDDQTRVDQ